MADHNCTLFIAALHCNEDIDHLNYLCNAESPLKDGELSQIMLYGILKGHQTLLSQVYEVCCSGCGIRPGIGRACETIHA